MTAANHDLISSLYASMRGQLSDLRLIESGFEVELEGRYGRLIFVFDHDPGAASIRVYTMVPTPPGAGPEFLRWCLSMNTLYWDVKVGLDARGMLLVLCDVDLDQADVTSAARVLLARVAAIAQLLDDDLVSYLLDNKLATATQRQRWQKWKK
jgi:hypothetical protein